MFSYASSLVNFELMCVILLILRNSKLKFMQKLSRFKPNIDNLSTRT